MNNCKSSSCYTKITDVASCRPLDFRLGPCRPLEGRRARPTCTPQQRAEYSLFQNFLSAETSVLQSMLVVNLALPVSIC